MPNKKKVNPRSSFIIVRVTKQEKSLLEQEAKTSSTPFSVFLRKLLKLDENND